MQVAPLAGKQREAVRLCTSRLNIFEGSVRSGKTIASLLAWLKFVRTGPPGNLLMCAKTGDTLKRNCLDPLLEMLGPTRCVHNMGTRELMLLGRKIYLASANDERSTTKIAGLSLVGAYGDELSTWPEAFFRMLGSRLSQRGARFYGSSNPDAPLHWLKRGYLDKASVHLTHAGDVVLSDAEDRLDLARLSFLLTDNPHLPREYIDALTAEYQGLWRKRYVEGLWVAAEGSVYDMFDPDRHVVAECPVIKRWLCAGIDYGSMNPFHAVLLGIGIDRRIYAVAEWRWDSRARHRQLTDAEYSAKLTEWLASVQFPGSMLRGVTPERIIVDPAAASFRAQLTRDRYVPVLADNAVLDGIRTVSSLLATGRLLIHASCKYLIDEMQGYVWDESAAAKGLDQPVKQDDHGADALRYALFTTRGIWRHMLRPPEAPPNLEESFGVEL